MKLKRLCAALLALVLLCPLVGCKEKDPYPPIETVGLADEGKGTPGEQDGYSYITYQTYTEIVKYEGEAISLILPDSLGGKPVKRIGDFAFQLNTKLASITLPSYLLQIGILAFYGCTSLSHVVWNDTLELIEDSAFQLTALTELTCPPRLYQIGREAFSGSALTSVHMSESVTVVEDYAFYGCTQLTEIFFSPRLTVLESRVFNGCTSLTELILPQTITSIENYVFGSCTALETLVIPNSVTSLGDGLFSGSPLVTVYVAEEGPASKYCDRNGTAFVIADEALWLEFYPETEEE